MESIVHRLNIIEEAIANGRLVTDVEKKGADAVKEMLDAAPGPQPMKEIPKSIPKDIQGLPRRVREAAAELSNGLIDAFMKDAHFSLSGEQLQIVLNDELAYEYFMQEGVLEQLEAMASEREGREIHIQLTYNKTGRDYNESYVDLESLINMDITVEEE